MVLRSYGLKKDSRRSIGAHLSQLLCFLILFFIFISLKVEKYEISKYFNYE